MFGFCDAKRFAGHIAFHILHDCLPFSPRPPVKSMLGSSPSKGWRMSSMLHTLKRRVPSKDCLFLCPETQDSLSNLGHFALSIISLNALWRFANISMEVRTESLFVDDVSVRASVLMYRIIWRDGSSGNSVAVPCNTLLNLWKKRTNSVNFAFPTSTVKKFLQKRSAITPRIESSALIGAILCSLKKWKSQTR